MDEKIMAGERARFLFLNLGHAYTHLFMLLYPTVVLALEAELGRGYAELLLPSTAGFLAFGAGTLPAGWLGDRWPRERLLALMFFGLAAGSVLSGLARTPWELAGGLSVIGLAAAIYHPVGIAMVVESATPLGRALGVNGVFGNLGVAAAPLAAGALSELFGWRAAFLVPGAVAGLTGAAFLLAVQASPARPRAPGRAEGPSEVHGLWRVVTFLIAANLFGGLVFHTTTIVFPKMLDESLGATVRGPFGAGGLASLIFACAAFAQIGVGALIDRYPVRPVALAVIALQAPLFLLLAGAAGWASFALGLVVMLFVFGEIPIGDALMARYSSAAWRARLYAFKYLLSLGVSAGAVPLAALLHEPGQGFARLFVLLAAFVAVIACAAAVLPRARGQAVRAPLPT